MKKITLLAGFFFILTACNSSSADKTPTENEENTEIVTTDEDDDNWDDSDDDYWDDVKEKVFNPNDLLGVYVNSDGVKITIESASENSFHYWYLLERDLPIASYCSYSSGRTMAEFTDDSRTEAWSIYLYEGGDESGGDPHNGKDHFIFQGNKIIYTASHDTGNEYDMTCQKHIDKVFKKQ